MNQMPKQPNGPIARYSTQYSADFVERTTQWVVERLSDPDHAKVAITVRDMMEYERDGCLQRARRSEAIETMADTACVLPIEVNGHATSVRFEDADSDEELASIARDWSLAAGDESYFEAVRAALGTQRETCRQSARQANRAALGLRAQTREERDRRRLALSALSGCEGRRQAGEDG